jgi:hypothetical protein
MTKVSSSSAAALAALAAVARKELPRRTKPEQRMQPLEKQETKHPKSLALVATP